VAEWRVWPCLDGAVLHRDAGSIVGKAPMCFIKIAEAEAVVSVNEKKWSVMHVQLRLDELRGPQTLGSL
jgi:hypothetical protein